MSFINEDLAGAADDNKDYGKFSHMGQCQVEVVSAARFGAARNSGTVQRRGSGWYRDPGARPE